MADVKHLLARMAEQRAQWVEVVEGKSVEYLRPEQVDLPGVISGFRLEHVIKYVRNWKGFSEADLLGAAIGSSDPIDFDRDLWAAYVRENVDVATKVAEAMAGTVSEYLKRRADTAKNSPTSST